MTGFDFRRTAMETESPEEIGYEAIRANLAESSMSDRNLADLGVALDDLTLFYGDHRGDPRLRELVAARGDLRPDDVLTTSGGALGLFLVSLCLLGPGSHAVISTPNYVSNLETPRALGGAVTPVPLAFDDGFAVDPGRISAAVTDQTTLISVTSPHNPTGTEIPPDVLAELVAIAERSPRARLLVDQTYAELSGGRELPDAAVLSSRAISVSGVSKTFGVPGIRQGWITCRDRDLMTALLGAKEQVVLTGSVLDEAAAAAILVRADALLPGIRADAARRRAIVAGWMLDHPALEWVEPTGGVTAFPRIRDGHDAPADWHRRLLADHGVLVGPGHWFAQSHRHFRIGWGWPGDAELRAGIAAIDAVLGISRRVPGDVQQPAR